MTHLGAWVARLRRTDRHVTRLAGGCKLWFMTTETSLDQITLTQIADAAKQLEIAPTRLTMILMKALHDD